MSYKSVFVCDECRVEASAVYPVATSGCSSPPELPDGWWAARQRFMTDLTFCCKSCLGIWAAKADLP